MFFTVCIFLVPMAIAVPSLEIREAAGLNTEIHLSGNIGPDEIHMIDTMESLELKIVYGSEQLTDKTGPKRTIQFYSDDMYAGGPEDQEYMYFEENSKGVVTCRVGKKNTYSTTCYYTRGPVADTSDTRTWVLGMDHNKFTMTFQGKLLASYPRGELQTGNCRYLAGPPSSMKFINFDGFQGSYNLSMSIAPCNAGSYMAKEGCSQCLGGTWSAANAKTCSQCPAGTWSADNAHACTDCPDGKMSPIGSTSPDSCYYAVKPALVTKYVNVAIGGAASQDSTGSGGIASRANDGDTNGNFFATPPSCTHTNAKQDTYWNLKLVKPVVVHHIIIYNRVDCCQNRINGAMVFVGAVLCGTVDYITGTSVYTIPCTSDDRYGVVGNEITVYGAPGQYLTLCEVEVMSNPSVSDLALKKPTSQSSIGWNGLSDRAVDGIVKQKYSEHSCSHTGGPGWWKVDLENFYNVEKIVIYNRVDCCSDRINGVEVYAGDVLCGTISYIETESVYRVPCAGGIVTDSVKIVNPNTYLTLCEVEVMGNDKVIAEAANTTSSSHQ